VKTAVFQRTGCIEVQEIPFPHLQSNEVLIRVLGCGVCGTDARIYRGELRHVQPPAVLGHEIFGRIEKLGGEVAGLTEGDPVVVDPFLFCGWCEQCKRGEYRFCKNELFIGYQRPGGYSQFLCVPHTNVHPVPKTMGIQEGVLVETLSTVLAGMSVLKPEAGKTCLLLGAGTVGLLWNRALKAALPAFLIQTDLVAFRRQKALALGADRVLSPREEILEKVILELCPEGVDYLVDATGCTQAVAEALPLLRKGGTLLVFGIPLEEETLPLSLNWFYKRQARFLTSRRPPGEMGRAIRLLERRFITAQQIVTGRYAISEIETAFARFTEARDREIKMMIDPWM